MTCNIYEITHKECFYRTPSGYISIQVGRNNTHISLPCTAEYYAHIYRNEDGSIGYNGKLGEYIYNELNLYLKRHQINYNLVRVNREIDELGEIIRKKRDKGEVVDKLEKLHYDLLQEFRHEVNELEQ